MSVSFIYQNLTFYYRIDSHSSAMVFIAWGCRELPISGEAHSKEHMMEDIKSKLKQYYRNRKPNECKECGLTSQKFESQDTCPECLTDEPNTNK